MSAVPEMRVGQGFDIHAFTDDPDRRLVLGGCTFEGEKGLAGHSDADVVAHACADALLGAAGLGDIGMHFSDTDDRWRGADSMKLLARVVEMLGAERWVVSNVDCSLVCERPKIAPRRDEMQRRLSEVVGGPVTVKGNRAERLGAIGRSEGVVCLASALIVRADGETGS